jgi:hypothetical protein
LILRQNQCMKKKWISCIHRLECDLYAKDEMVRFKTYAVRSIC